MVFWTQMPPGFQDTPKPFQWVEFFAGEAQATEQMKYYGGRTTARLDIVYMSDKNGVPGTNPMDITSPCGMATALQTVLRGDHEKGWACHFGLKCASWTSINSGTSGRSACSSIGNLDYQSVLTSNCMASRMILLMMIVVCLNGTIILEQPFGSFFEHYPRWRDFVMMLLRHGGNGAVHRTTWYMLHYGGPTPKRHVAWANSRHIGRLNLGRLIGWAKRKRELASRGQAPPQLVQKYFDKSGKRRYKGTSKLRSSENYPPAFGRKMSDLWNQLVSEKSGMPSLPDPIPPALETFTSLDMDDVWTEADMPAVCRYLRGGTSLRIPDSFRDVLPKKI
ncbi:unnamed protein product [Cladocopium goreaui]|uniref:Uncharacterized protein n=1 Tax=Cladocopium goreaui TaxID=2562237 RepID=A0A9P1BQ63_9DINO|nr:unnamed protein product [Cladocopium goreaui]CAI4010168.1 unnamed protein product [Cladocopium goreaui]CAI4018557.1 unnamed protein product [Cladocopium goreaui]